MSGKALSWKARIVVGILAALTLTAGQSHGQSQAITATISGTVLDPTGQTVSGAKITLVSPERGISRTYVTTDNGLYSFTLLPPATYRLQVEAAGFKHYRQDGIELIPGQNAEQNVGLIVGAISENIEVTSQAPLMNAENANISSDISARQVVELPLNFRSVIGLATLSSSVSNAAEDQIVGAPASSGAADQDVSFLNFGGTFFNTAAYLLDGTYDTRLDWGGVIYVPSVDAVQEFKIQTNAFTSQYGWSSGNVINVVTKSGSNEYHGDAYEFYRNSSVESRNFFNSGPQPSFTRNQFGGTFGGPIRKNKTFFFGYYEGRRQATPATFLGTMPTSDQRNGDFSAFLGPQAGVDYIGRPIYSGEIYNPFSTRQVACGGTDPVTGNGVSNCPATDPPGTIKYIRDPISGNIQTGLGVTNIIPGPLMDTIAKSIATGCPSAFR